MRVLRQNAQNNYNFIDLFAGAGGLSEGFLQAGFRPVAHVEMNEFAAKTLETRSAYYYLKGANNLAMYKKYMQGKMTREELMKNIPASIIKTIINETMGDAAYLYKKDESGTAIYDEDDLGAWGAPDNELKKVAETLTDFLINGIGIDVIEGNL